MAARSSFFCLALAALTLADQPAVAATVTSTFEVKITIQEACVITATNEVNFGTQGLLTANVDTSATLSVQCTSGKGYTIALSAGAGSGATVAARKMTGPASATVTYSLFRDAGRSLVWGDTVGTDTVAATGNGAVQNYTVYGRVPPQTTPAAGDYLDTITVTVEY